MGKQDHRCPESPPGFLASSLLGCEDGPAGSHPASNVPQNRSCHEKRRAPTVYVIIRDGTITNDR